MVAGRVFMLFVDCLNTASAISLSPWANPQVAIDTFGYFQR